MLRKLVYGVSVIVFSFVLAENENSHNAIDTENYKEEDYGKTWIYFPDGNNIPRIAKLGPSPDEAISGRFLENEALLDTVTFCVYTKKNPLTCEFLETNQIETLKTSAFDSNKKTKILTHGWQSSRASPGIQFVKNSFLGKQDVNVITVDWQQIAKLNYFTAASTTPKVGEKVAEFLKFLTANGVQLEDVHLIGHSLGAHVSGFTGNSIQNTVGPVARITGLDPALPQFGSPYPPPLVEGHLNMDHAKFVDVIHTCAGVLGFLEPIGHIDFYPNGGLFQPGCRSLVDVIETCSHGRAFELYAESIVSLVPFLARECESYINFQMGYCDGNELEFMGEPVSQNRTGIYYLNTKKQYPFVEE